MRELTVLLTGFLIITNFAKEHADCRNALAVWCDAIKEASWNNPQDIKKRFQHASFLPNNQVIFNIKGNKYRLETQVHYSRKTVMVNWIGSHDEYSKLNRE